MRFEGAFMSYKFPIHVSEVKLTYETKIKAKDRPQIHGANDAYWVLESNWSDQIRLLAEFNILLLDQSDRVMGMSHVS